MSCKLIAQKGPSSGTSYLLEQQEIFMGRDLSNDIVVNDPEISRRHARLYKQGGNYVIEDLGSTNGTVVNGQKIRGPKQLATQDQITIGQSIAFLFVDERPAAVPSDATIVAGDMYMSPQEDATVIADGHSAMPMPMPEPSIPDEFAYSPVTPEAPAAYFQEPWEKPDVPSTPSVASSGVKRASSSPSQKKKIPIWLIIIVVLLLITCVCVGTFILIDTLNVWCDLLPFLPGCPVG